MVQNNPDYDTEEPVKEKGPVALFFLRGWSNLVRLMGTNALLVIFNIPCIVLSVFLSFVFVPLIAPLFIDLESYIDPVTGSDAAVLELFILLVFFSVNLLVSGSLICIGPFQTGFAQVYKDIRNGNSVSFLTSFRSGLKTGWKKGIAAMIIGFVITPVLLLAVSFYFTLNTGVGTAIGVVFSILLVAFILVQNFVYTMIITTDLKLAKIYKNAVIFLFVRALPCLGAALIVIIFYFIIPFILLMSASYMTLGIFIFLYSFITVSWVQYFLSSFCMDLVERYVADGEA
ncbi:MAG: hypothetical protein IKG03_05655 [Clostridiales bacterium]|nr:hypothetical protein [Clostridiales bacterium]